MKKLCALILVLLAAALPLTGCSRHSGGYTLLDIPKELEIDVSALSEDADDLMNVSQPAPLLAALPEKGLYVYATDQTVVSGVLVKYDGLLQFFPWRFVPQLARPDLFVSDYNGDGKADIAFTYVFEAGVQARRETLHILLRGDEGFTDNVYTGEKAALEAARHLSVTADDEPDTFTTHLNGVKQTFTLAGHGEFLDLFFDDVQDFTLGDEITVRLEPSMVFADEGLPTGDVITYTAHVEFVNNILSQTKMQIELQQATEDTE